MSTLLILSFLWVLASAIVAMLPMRYQYVPGAALLIAAPSLILLIGLQHGWIFAALGMAAFASMFRYPLRYFYTRFRNHDPESSK